MKPAFAVCLVIILSAVMVVIHRAASYPRSDSFPAAELKPHGADGVACFDHRYTSADGTTFLFAICRIDRNTATTTQIWCVPPQFVGMIPEDDRAPF